MEVFAVISTLMGLFALVVSIWQRAEMSHSLARIRELREAAREPKETPLAQACHHEWGVLKEEKLQNEREQMTILILQCKYCGNLDKTVESVSLPDPPKPTEPRSECRHHWEKQKSVELESAYEQMKGNSESCESFQPWMFRKTVIIQRICSRCGEISTIESSNYDLESLPEGSSEGKPYRKPKETRSYR